MLHLYFIRATKHVVVSYCKQIIKKQEENKCYSFAYDVYFCCISPKGFIVVFIFPVPDLLFFVCLFALDSSKLSPHLRHLLYLEFFKSSGINSGWNTNKSLPYVVWQNPEQMLRQVNQSWAEMINCQISSKNVQIKINKNVAFQLLTFEF